MKYLPLMLASTLAALMCGAIPATAAPVDAATPEHKRACMKANDVFSTPAVPTGG